MGYEQRSWMCGEGALCRYDGVPGLYRGPACDQGADHIAFVGGCDGFGEFIDQPLPDLLATGLGVGGVNFALPGGGVDLAARHPGLMARLNDASVVVMQITGAQALSNRFYSVHPRRNDRFTAPSPALRQLFPRVNFFEIHFVRHLLEVLEAADTAAFDLVVAELQAAWQARMHCFLDRISTPVLLLWWADHAPGAAHGHPPRAPLYLTPDMVAGLAERARLVQVVASPQSLAMDALQGTAAPESPVRARHLFGPAVHREAAAQVLPVLAQMLCGPKQPGRTDPVRPVQLLG